MILSTRTLLARRRLFLVVALLCLLMGAFAGLHAGGHDDSVSTCGLVGLGCAVAVALVLLPRIGGRTGVRPKIGRPFAPFDDHLRCSVVLPTALGLAELCRLRV